MTRSRRGFTLLETMVALAVLALSLMAIFDLTAGAVANHAYTKKLTVATLLARSKMEDLEQELHDSGFPNDDDEQSGDFSDEGWSQFKWRAKILAPQTDSASPEQLLSALFNLPVGDSGGLASLFGGGAGGGAGPAGASPLQGAAMGAAQPMFTQMVSQIQRAVREVQLTVYWKEGTQVESLDLVTHVVSLGPGSDRNGGLGPGGSAANPPPPPNDLANQWVDPNSGLPVPNPVPGPNGVMLHPQTRQPLMRRLDWLNQRGGGLVGSGLPGVGPQPNMPPPGVPGGQR